MEPSRVERYIDKLEEALEPVRDDIFGAYLYGSQTSGKTSSRSDVDVCIVAGPDQEPLDALRAVWRKTTLGQPPYDVHVFEELPLYLKAEVLEHGQLILSRDAPKLSEYLRRWRKIWNDQKHRNETTQGDLDRIFDARA